MEVPINYWALIVSAVISIILGFIWYGPLFGKQWMALAKIAMPDVKPSMKVMIKPMIISIIGGIFMAFAFAHSLVFAQAYLGISGVSAGLQGAFWMWLGFIVPVHLNFVGWEGKPWKLFFINVGYWLVLLGITGVILTVWK